MGDTLAPLPLESQDPWCLPEDERPVTLTQEHLEVLAQRYTAARRGQNPTSLSFSPNRSLGVDDDDLPPGHGRVTEVAVNWVVA